VTDAMVDDRQRIVDGLNEHFIAAVQSGRGFSDERTRELFDGRVHVGTEAHRLGLVDGVSSFDEAMATLIAEVQTMDSKAFAAYTAENPEALKAAASGLIEAAVNETHVKAHAEGVTEERDRCLRIASMSGDPKIIARHISSPAAVKDELFDAQQKRIADLEAKLASGETTIAGVGFAPAAETEDKPASDDPKAVAAWEFDNDKATFKAKDKDAYVRARTAALTGRMSLVG
jgi:ClpP class serine protease